MAAPPSPGPPPIDAAKTLKKVMADHFFELDEAVKTGEKKVAWCTSVGPAELLLAFDFLVYYPENHGAMLGATRMAPDMIPAANAIGYSPEICSYLTSDIGAFLQGVTPLQKAYNIQSVPRPDVLAFNTNQCRDVQDWFMWYARHFGVPCVGIHTHRDIGEVGPAQIADISSQIKDLIPHLEAVSGQKFDLDKFREIIGLSKECSVRWRKVLETCLAAPSPMNFFDATIHMGPAVVMRGRQESLDYYNLLLPELEQRIKDGVASVPGERHRLYWEGMPVWGKLRANAELFGSLGACIVASTYCNSWIFDAFDPAEPFDSMARAYTELFIVRDEAYKEEYVIDHVNRFQINGIVYHDAKTCPNNSNNRYGMPQRLADKLGIPFLTINGDLNDLRLYSEEQTRTNVEAFVEQLDEAA
ncbi:MAG: 2-hydroxyacyl-CoA dehydratase family protein [Proteobacteria bacterium]|nr:2-hydroxyacyl-CoA dehydratase family protein [Pseudomonadota bacterium]